MHNNKRKNFIIMSVLVCTLIIMSTGYAILTQVIKVDGTVTVERDWDVKITGITDGTPVGAAENEVAPTYDATTASFSTLLYNKGDSMTYAVTIENFGSWDAKLETITLTDSQNPAVKFTVSGINEGDALPSGSTHVLTVKVEYDSAFNGELTDNVGNLTVNLTYVQDDSSSVVPTPPVSESSVVYSKNIVYEEQYINVGDSLDQITGYTEDYTTLNSHTFLKHIINNDVVESNEVCFIINDVLHCLKPNEYETSKASLISIFGESSCTDDTDTYRCSRSGVYEEPLVNAYKASAFAPNSVNARGGDSSADCFVYTNGSAKCGPI